MRSFLYNPRLERRFVIISYVLLFAIYISMSLHFPVSVLSTLVHDDAWYMKNAQTIIAGHWFGHFNQMTLIKGPGYSYFLALNYLLGVPVSLSTALLYLAACTGLVWVARRAGVQKPLAWALFVFLLFQPAEFPVRIIRDNIYTSLSMITISGWAYLTLNTGKGAHRLFVAMSGLSAGLYWITREEGVWILPSLLILGLFGVIVAFKNKTSLGFLSKGVAIYVGFAALPILSTGLVNYVKYKSFQVVDFKSSAFAHAVNVLNAVNVGEEIQFLPVPLKKREAMYKVSPAFQELEPYFENEGKGWTQFGCKLYPQTCGDYAAGWFMWALRDGVASRGYYASPRAAEGYYNRLSHEIEIACADGRLSCSKSSVFVHAENARQRCPSPARKISRIHPVIDLPGAYSNNSRSQLIYLAANDQHSRFSRKSANCTA